MKRKMILVALLVALVMAPVAASTSGAAKTKFGVGVNLGTDVGASVQYKMKGMDLIATVDYGFLYGYVGGTVGVNFKVADFNWTPGDWYLTIGATGTVGWQVGLSSFYLSVNAPFRLNYTFPREPWSFYISAAPGVQICPSPSFSMQGGLGALYLFN